MDLEPQLCRLCLTSVDPASVVILNHAANLIESILQLTTIDVIVDPSHDVFMCDQCQTRLDLSIQFRTMCLQNDDTFRKLHAKHCLPLEYLKDESEDWTPELVQCKIEIQHQNNEMLKNLEPETNISDLQVQKYIDSHSNLKVKKPRKKKKRKLNVDQDSDRESTEDVKVKIPRQKHKSKSTWNPPSASESPNAKVQCQICGGFYSRDVLRKHLPMHNDDRRMFACDQCPKKYPHKKNLTAHIRIVHEGKVDHTCDQCGKTYCRKEALKQHYTAEHTDLVNYECNICGEKFARASSLHYHNTMIHSSLRPHACGYCEMTFKRSTDLKNHVRTHTGEKPFKCDLCDKTFAKSYNVVIHKKSHKNAEMRQAAQSKVDHLEQNVIISDVGTCE